MKNNSVLKIFTAGGLTAMVLTVALMLALFNGFYGAKDSIVYANSTAGSTAAAKGQITVNGAGAVNVKPDVAYITLGVSTQNASPKVAQDKNNQLITAVIEALKKAGIEEKDIRTTNYYMYPMYDYQKGYETIIGYNINNSVAVTVRDITMVGDVLGAGVDAGANVTNGVKFSILDSAAAYNDALKLAIKNGMDKANSMAAAIGKKVSSPLYINESGGYYMPVSNSGYAAEMPEAASDSVGRVPAQAGELTVSANVQMAFEYDR